MKKYSSQALAIVLVLLIVGSIVGFALYARMIRESERVVDERSSSKANELAETMSGLINSVGYERVNNEDVIIGHLGCEYEWLESPSSEVCRAENLSLVELEEMFSDIVSEEVDYEIDFSRFSQEFVEDFCLGELSIRNLSYGAEGVLIEQDESYSVFLSRADWNSCWIDFEMKSKSESSAAEGFVMSKLYGKYDENNNFSYKPYELDDVFGFKYVYDAGDINWKDPSLENKLFFSNSNIIPNMNLGIKEFKVESEVKSYALDEVRFKSLGGTSLLSWEADRSCNIGDHLLVEVGATCGGKYAGKSFILPEVYFSPPVFDYVYFQGQGDLVTEFSGE